MLLYWGFFTIGFMFGSILAYLIFAPKTTEVEEAQEEKDIERALAETNLKLPSFNVSLTKNKLTTHNILLKSTS